MSNQLKSWPRPHYTRTDGHAFLFYVVYGTLDLSEPLSSDTYRSAGPPDGLDLMAYGRATDLDVLTRFCEGFDWDELRKSDQVLAARIEAAPECVILRGELPDPPTLDYLRDCIGTISCMFDRGAVAVYDPQILRWWTPEEWQEEVFEPAGPVPGRHATVLLSEEPDGFWFHTRGMRKFARPDISVRRVGPKYREAVIDLCNRFIEFMAFGGKPAEGEIIRMKSLPAGGVVRHGGDLDDPDFNNVHFEVEWPGNGLL